MLNNRGDVGRRRPEVATGTYFALYLDQHCDERLNTGKAGIRTVGAPHVKHSRLRGHATSINVEFVKGGKDKSASWA